MNQSVLRPIELDIHYELAGDESWIASLCGTINFSTADPFKNAIDLFLQKKPKCLLFDLADVHYISSLGLSAIAHLYKQSKQADIPIKLYDPQQPVRRVLEISKFDFLLLDPANVEGTFQIFQKFIENNEPQRVKRRQEDAKRKIPPRLYA